MTATEYREALKQLGVTQHGAAKFLGVDPRTSQRWCKGDAPIPVAVQMVLNLMLMLGVTVNKKTGKVP